MDFARTPLEKNGQPEKMDKVEGMNGLGKFSREARLGLEEATH